MTFNADEMVRDINDAKSIFDAEIQKLCREDGQPKWSEPEMQERQAALRAALDEGLGRAQEQVVAEIERAKTELSKLNRDPLYSLDTEALNRATTLASFIRDEVERLDADALGDEIEAAIAANDRPALLLYRRELAFKQRAGLTAASTGQLSDAASEERATQAAMLKQLDRALVDERQDRRRAQYESELTTARDVQRQLGQVRSGDLKEGYLAQARQNRMYAI